MSGTPNRFDFLRLLFASVVVVYHIVVLTSVDIEGAVETWLSIGAEISIQGFFIASGALVFGSLERSRSVLDYAGKRVRRLYPAYSVIVILPALVAIILSWGVPGALREVGRYLAANLVFLNFLQPTLPGLFDGQRFDVVNGALWTLKIEVMFYLSLPILAWGLGKLGRYWWYGIAVLYIGGVIWSSLLPLSAQISRQLPGQMAFFASGMVLWRVWPLAKAMPSRFGLVGLILFAVSFVTPMAEPMRAAGLAGLIAWAAFTSGPALNVARWGDVSYGAYITHFPIVQALIMAGTFVAVGPVAGFVVAAGLICAASYALWWWVEKPALRATSHYRQVSKSG